MAMSNRNGDFLVHSNGSIPSNATGLSTTSSTDGDITTSPNQQSPKEVQRTKKDLSLRLVPNYNVKLQLSD
ncbi:UNVERIFIED_CONTAM: hypothetical protein FKN15_050585 [Acipenser sinensis]